MHIDFNNQPLAPPIPPAAPAKHIYVPNALLSKIFSLLPIEDQKTIRLVDKRFNRLSPLTCLTAIKRFAETGKKDDLACIDEAQNLNFSPEHARLAKKIKLSDDNMVFLLSSKKRVRQQLGAYFLSFNSIKAERLESILLTQKPGPLGKLLKEFKQIVAESKRNPAPIPWKKVNEFLNTFYDATSLARGMLCYPYSGNAKVPLLEDLRNLLQRFPQAEYENYPLIVFSKALSEKLPLTKIIKHDTYRRYIPSHRRLMLEAVKKVGAFYNMTDPAFKLDPKFIATAVKRDGPKAMKDVPAHCLNDPKLYFKLEKELAVRAAIARAPESIKSSLEIARHVLKHDPVSIKHFSDEIQNNREIAFLILEAYSNKHSFHKGKLTNLPPCIRQAIKTAGLADLSPNDPAHRQFVKDYFGYRDVISEACRSDVTLMLEAIGTWSLAQFPDLQDNVDIVRSKVNRNFYELEYASDRILNDAKLLEAVLADYVAKDLPDKLAYQNRNDRFICNKLASRDKFLQKLASINFPLEKTDLTAQSPEQLLDLIRCRPAIYCSVPPHLRASPSFALEALRNAPPHLAYVIALIVKVNWEVWARRWTDPSVTSFMTADEHSRVQHALMLLRTPIGKTGGSQNEAAEVIQQTVRLLEECVQALKILEPLEPTVAVIHHQRSLEPLDYPPAQYKAAWALIDKDNYRSFLRQAAEKGIAEAEYLFGLLLYEGQEEQDGLHWMEKAAAHGHYPAYYILAKHYLQEGPSQDLLRACHYAEQFTQKGPAEQAQMACLFQSLRWGEADAWQLAQKAWQRRELLSHEESQRLQEYFPALREPLELPQAQLQPNERKRSAVEALMSSEKKRDQGRN